MSKRLFEYAIIADEKLDANHEVIKEAEIIAPLKQILAKDDRTVAMIAAKDIPDSWMDEIDRVQVVVRPF